MRGLLPTRQQRMKWSGRRTRPLAYSKPANTLNLSNPNASYPCTSHSQPRLTQLHITICHLLRNVLLSDRRQSYALTHLMA